MQFSKCSYVPQSWWNCSLNVKQLGSGWDAELLGVSSGSKLFAHGNSVVLGGLWVNCSIYFIIKDKSQFCHSWCKLLPIRHIQNANNIYNYIISVVTWMFCFFVMDITWHKGHKETILVWLMNKTTVWNKTKNTIQ